MGSDTLTPIGDDQLLRRSYHDRSTDAARDYYVYLPAGYGKPETTPAGGWPVILYLHGTGERGDGQAELPHVLRYGPLHEAWLYRRALPFVMISPQLPLFNMHDHAKMRGNDPPPPEKLAADYTPPPRHPDDRPTMLVTRTHDNTPNALEISEQSAVRGLPGGWEALAGDLLGILDATLEEFATNPQRVHLNGVSYGGYGAWNLAIAAPDRFASLLPVCGDADPARVVALARPRAMPIWIHHGGRDGLIKPHWPCRAFNALEAVGHSTIRFTVYEELGHAIWLRVYPGLDLYQWMLAQ